MYKRTFLCIFQIIITDFKVSSSKYIHTFSHSDHGMQR